MTVMAAGDPITETNLITAPITAAVMRNIRGFDVGVLDNSFLSVESTDENYKRTPSDSFKLDGTTNLSIQIKAGMATAYGFDLYNDQTRVFSVGEYPDLANASSGVKYVFFYLQWNFSNPLVASAEMDCFDNGVNPNWTPPLQNNLAENPTGQYIMPLYRIAIDSSGNVTDVQDWTKLGTPTYKGVKWSRLTDIAEESKQARMVIDRSSGANNLIAFYIGNKTVSIDY